MENNKNFSSLDPLGPQFGRINEPSLDPISMEPFEGDHINIPKLSFPEVYKPVIPSAGSLDKQDQNIKRNIVGSPSTKPGLNLKGMSGNDKSKLINDYIRNTVQANQDKNSFSKLYAYNAGSSGNSFYKRYLAYGAEKFTKVGFNPIRDNEANFNAQTTAYDDWSRMMNHSFIPLLTRGFVSGPKSLFKMLQGDFTSSDLEDARAYEEAAAIGQSTKGGALGFINNAQMNFAYTAGIMGEAIVEEIVGAVLAAPTGGASLFATTANASKNIFKGLKGLDTLNDGFKAVRKTLNTLNNAQDARKYWQATKQVLGAPLRYGLENTVNAYNTAKKLDNIGNLALLSKTAGGFYQDVRSINMAVSEARLEAGMVENKVYDNLYKEYYKKNGVAPTNKEQAEMTKQAKEASLETFYTNAGLIFATNKITFSNITSPRGGLRNFIKSSTDDILEIASREGEKNFGKYGKVIYDKAAKQFSLEKNNLKNLAKSWYKNPGFKTASKTIGYFKSNFSEGIQENLQEVISRANEKYYTESYQSPYLKGHLYSKSAIDNSIINRNGIFNTPGNIYMSELGKEFSSQGLETFASGFVMGAFAHPINSAIPFLSAQWNRTFDKEAYTKWKDTKANTAKNLVDNLNKMSVKEFLSNRYYNAGAQDTLSLIKEAGSKKEGLDSELESYINQVDAMLSTNTSDLFIEKLESLKELTDEELIDHLKLEGDQVNNVNKYRDRIDKSVSKLKNIQKAFNKVEELLPIPVTLPEEDDIDKDDKEFMYYSWKLAQKNFVYFNEAYKDNLSRINKIQENYLNTPNLQNLSNTDVSYLFDPFRLGDALNSIKLELTSLIGTDPSNKNRIDFLKKKQKTLSDYQEAYEEFNKVYNRTQYVADIKAQLVAEKIEPTPEAIQERMEKEYGVEGDTKKQDKVVAKLKKAHEDYLNAIASSSDTILFKGELDDSFRDLLDLYKLKQESKDVAKFANFIADPQGFYNTVISNLKWMRGMYNTRAEYFTNLVNEQMNNAISNSLLNKLAEKNLYISLDDFNELKENGTLPSEFYDDTRKLAINKGTSRYKEIVDEYIIPYLEIIKEKAEPKVEQKNLQETRETFKTKMEAEIAKLPKEERVVDEQVLVKEDGTTYSVSEAYNVMPNDYYMDVVATGKGFNSKLKFVKENDKLYQFNVDDEGLPTKEELSVEQIKLFDELPISKITIYKLEEAPNPEDVEAIKKKYAEKLEQEQQDFDSTRPEAMQKSIDEILELAKKYESVVQTKTNYFLDGIKHERMSNAIKSKVSLFTSLKRPKIEELIDSTIGIKGFTEEGLKSFMNALENEYGDTSGFDQDVYKAIKEELESIIPVLQMTVSTAINPQLKARLNALGYRDSFISDLSKEEQKRILDEGIEFEDYTPTEDIEAKKADIEKRKEERIKKVESKFWKNNEKAYLDFLDELGGYELKAFKNDSEIIDYLKQRIETKYNTELAALEQTSEKSNNVLGIDIKKLEDLDNLTDSQKQKLKDAVKNQIELLPDNQVYFIHLTPFESDARSILKNGLRTGIAIESTTNMVSSKQGLLEAISAIIDGKVRHRNSANLNIIGFDKTVFGTNKINADNLVDYLAETHPNFFNELTIPAQYNVGLFTNGQLELKNVQSKTTNAYRSQGSAAIKTKINSLNNEISNLVSIRDTAKNQSVIDKQIKALQNKKQELESELKQSQEKTFSDEELKNYIVNTIDENTYENKRKGGTYLDNLVKNFLDGQQIDFDESKISEEAFDSLFGKNGFITDIRNRIDSGELWVYAKNLVVASDKLIDDNDNILEPVAGEIDFIFVDKEGNKFIVDLKSADAKKWTQYRSDSGYGFNKRAENTLQQVGYANLIENTIGKKYGITILPVALEYEGRKIAYASRPDIVLDIEKQPIGDPNEKPFNVTLDSNIIIPFNEADGTVVNLTAKEIMQRIIPVNPTKKTKGKAQPQAKTPTPAPTEQVTFTKEELAEIASWQKFAERFGAEYALQAFHSNIYPEVMRDDLIFFEKDGITPSKLYNAIINVINEVGTYESNLPVKVSNLPQVNSKYYALNANFVQQYSEVVVLESNIDNQTITFKNTGKGKFKSQTLSLQDFMENFSSYTNVENPTEEPTYTPTDNEKQNATENKTNVDEFLNSSYINTVEEEADSISIEEAKRNLFNDLNC